MEYLGNLKDFLRAVIDFTPTTSLTLIRQVPPDVTEQLSKAHFKRFYSWFNIDSYEGKRELEDFTLENPVARVESLQLVTYPGTIRQFNPAYEQNQMITRKAFGVNIDFMPRKKQTGETIIVLLGPEGLKRPSFNTTEFMTEKMKETISAYNIQYERLSLSADISSVLPTTPKRSGVQSNTRLQRNQSSSSRASRLRQAQNNGVSNLLEFPSIFGS